MLQKWRVREGEFKGLEVIVLGVQGGKCICIDRYGFSYYFDKDNLETELGNIIGGVM